MNKDNGNEFFVYFRKPGEKIWELYWPEPVVNLESASKYCSGARIRHNTEETLILNLNSNPPKIIEDLANFQNQIVPESLS